MIALLNNVCYVNLADNVVMRWLKKWKVGLSFGNYDLGF